MLLYVGVAFVLFRQRILFRIQEAVHLSSNLWLELVIILFPAAFLNSLTAKVVQYMAHQSTTKKNEEEVERPATTRSGRAITRRSEIDFFLFIFFFNEFRVNWLADFVIHSSLLCTTKSAIKKFTLSESDRCNCSMNCNTLIMPKTYCVTVQYV